MKIRLVVALVGLAMSFALPAFAQQKDTVDPQTEQQIRALAMKYDEAFNRSEHDHIDDESEAPNRHGKKQ